MKPLGWANLALGLCLVSAAPAYSQSLPIISAQKTLASHDPEGENASLPQAETALHGAARNYAAGKWAEAKSDLERAKDLLENAAQSEDEIANREAQKLSEDLHVLLGRMDTDSAKRGRDIEGLWERSKALVERALDYQTAGWEKLQASSAGAGNLIEAKLRVSYGAIYELTTGDDRKARAELQEAVSYVGSAEAQVGKALKPDVERIKEAIKAAQAGVGRNTDGKSTRYDEINRELTRLIH